MDQTTTAEGSPAWARVQLQAGRRIRKSIWALGHVRLEGDKLVVLDGNGREMPVPDSFLALDFTGAWLWELDLPRRFAFATATRVDLAVLPPDITVGQLALALDRCRGTDRNYNAVILSAWQAVGSPEVGQRIVEYLNSPEGYVAVLGARAGHDKDALPSLLKTIEGLKGGAQ